MRGLVAAAALVSTAAAVSDPWRRCKAAVDAEEGNATADARVPQPITFSGAAKQAARTARRSGGCGQQLPAGLTPGKATTVDITIGDPGFSGGSVDRVYRVVVPSTYSAADSHPLLFHFHGFCGNQNNQDKYSSIGGDFGAITVFPRGMGDGSCNSWNNNNAGPEGDASCTSQARAECFDSCNRLGKCSRCNCYTCADDAAFVTAMLEKVSSEMCIDMGRVYAAGYSNGGGEAYHLPTLLPDVFAAALSVHGQPFQGVFTVPSTLKNTALLHVGGLNDRIIPVDGSPSTCGFVYVSQNAATQAWADVHDCGNGEEEYSTPYDGTSGLACKAFSGCSSGPGSVVKCTIRTGHNFPSVSYELGWWFLLQHSR